jgi:ribonuclease J
MLKPEHIIPCHGDIEMRANYAALAAEEGYELNRQTHLLMNGGSIEL